MDRQGVDVQVVSPSPSHYYPWAGEELAAWAAQRGEPGHRRARRGRARPAARPRARAAAASAAHRRGARGRRDRARARRRRALVVRGRRRALGRAARAVLDARRGARRDRVPAPVRLQPRRAARPLLPLEHGRSAGRERRRALAPHLLGRARPASEPATRRGARRRLPADVPRSLRPRVAGAARGARMPRAAVVVPATPAVRLARAHPRRTPRARRCRRRRPGAARHRLPVRHGRRRPDRARARGRARGRRRARDPRRGTQPGCSRPSDTWRSAPREDRTVATRRPRRRGLRRRRRRRALPAGPDGRRRARRRARRGARARGRGRRRGIRAPRRGRAARPPRAGERARLRGLRGARRGRHRIDRRRESRGRRVVRVPDVLLHEPALHHRRPAPSCARRGPSASTSSSRSAPSSAGSRAPTAATCRPRMPPTTSSGTRSSTTGRPATSRAAR